MSLTNVIGCIEAGGDVVCLAQNPANQALALAGSADNSLYLVDLRELRTLFRVQDFADTVTCVRWTSPTQFLAGSLDGHLNLYNYDPAEYPQPLLVGSVEDMSSIANLQIYKQFAICQSEDSQLFVADFSRPDEPRVSSCVFVEGLQETLLYKHQVLMFGTRQYVSLDLKTQVQANITPANTVLSGGARPSASFADRARGLVFVGFDCGVTEIYQVGQKTLQKVQTLSGVTTAGVNVITSYKLFGNQYYFVGTNDALYCYESSFALRAMAKLQGQGVSDLLLLEQQAGQGAGIVQKALGEADASVAKAGEHIDVADAPSRRILSPMRLVAGCTDGQVAVFDALSLGKVCSFDAVQGEDSGVGDGAEVGQGENAGVDLDDDDSDYVRPVLAMGVLDDALVVTGDHFIYLYSTAFEEIGREEDRLEEEASLGAPDEGSVE